MQGPRRILVDGHNLHPDLLPQTFLLRACLFPRTSSERSFWGVARTESESSRPIEILLLSFRPTERALRRSAVLGPLRISGENSANWTVLRAAGTANIADKANQYSKISLMGGVQKKNELTRRKFGERQFCS
jgi:hypothetical protein